MMRIFPIKDNKIVFSNHGGKGYGGNGKYIAESLLKSKEKFDLVWVVKGKMDVPLPQNIRVVRYNSLKYIYEMATAKVWIDNCRKNISVRKRKKQYYIQTWHGGTGLKRVEKDVETNLSSIYVKNAKYDSKIADLFISNSKFCTDLYRSAFWYNGEILECGTPRCDILLNDSSEVHKKVRRYFNIDDNSHILIYAPTFRTDLNTDVYNIDFDELLKVLEKKFEGNWTILVRLHPDISSKSNFMEYNLKVINATNYDDMYELLVASDILITDYSSTIFEFSLINKPVILYAPDIESYSSDRNFYFDIYSLPYPLTENNHQLSEVIENFDSKVYSKEVSSFLSEIGIMEKGNASSKVVEKIEEVMEYY